MELEASVIMEENYRR